MRMQRMQYTMQQMQRPSTTFMCASTHMFELRCTVSRGMHQVRHMRLAIAFSQVLQVLVNIFEAANKDDDMTQCDTIQRTPTLR